MKEGRVDRWNCFHLHDSVSMFLVVKSELVTFEIVDCPSLVSKGKPKMSQSVSVQVSVRLDVMEWYNLQSVLTGTDPPCGERGIYWCKMYRLTVGQETINLGELPPSVKVWKQAWKPGGTPQRVPFLWLMVNHLPNVEPYKEERYETWRDARSRRNSVCKASKKLGTRLLF